MTSAAGAPSGLETPDPATQQWIASLRAGGLEGAAAADRLYALLLKAARFEVRRRASALGFATREHLDDLATQAAGDACVAVLAKLDEFRGGCRFTTWAYKFALLEAGVAVRRRAWEGREVVLDAEVLATFRDRAAWPAGEADAGETLAILFDCIAEELTPRQRAVIVALAVDGVPIDVLAERMCSTRGALYKTLHDARGKLRTSLAARGVVV